MIRLTNPQKALIAVFLIAVATASAWWYAVQCKNALTPSEAQCSTADKLLPAVDLIPIFVISGIVLGCIVFYLIVEAQKKAGGDMKMIFSLLPSDEQIIMRRLFEKGGEAMQSELTRLEGMTKVKSHRIVQRLAQKGIVKIQRQGKTNIVKLNKEFLN